MRTRAAAATSLASGRQPLAQHDEGLREAAQGP